MMKNWEIVLLLIFNICYAQNDMSDFITSKKWIINNEEAISVWNLKMMPVILNFEDGMLFTNFSSAGYNYSISNNNILIEKIKKFEIIKLNDNEIILKSINNEDLRKYIAVNKGSYYEIDMNNIKDNLIKERWNLDGVIIQFDKTMSLKCYDLLGNFTKAGIYIIKLYNGQIILTIQFDGNFKRDIYYININEKDCFVLESIDGQQFLMCKVNW